jgi:hypothetical protein
MRPVAGSDGAQGTPGERILGFLTQEIGRRLSESMAELARETPNREVLSHPVRDKAE